MACDTTGHFIKNTNPGPLVQHLKMQILIILFFLFLFALPALLMLLGLYLTAKAIKTKKIPARIAYATVGLLLCYPVLEPLLSDIYMEFLCKKYQKEEIYTSASRWKASNPGELSHILPPKKGNARIAYTDGDYFREQINSHFAKDQRLIPRGLGINEIRLKLVDTKSNQIMTETTWLQQRIKMGDAPDLAWRFRWPFRGNACKPIQFFHEYAQLQAVGFDSERLRKEEKALLPENP